MSFQRDEYQETYGKGPGCLLWLAWVLLTILGTTAAAALASILEPAPANQPSGFPYIAAIIYGTAVAGVLAGLITGGLQGLVLFPYLRGRGWLLWMAASTAGGAVEWLLASIYNAIMANVTLAGYIGFCLSWVLPAATGFVAGAITGYPQALIFRRRAEGWLRWIVGTAVAFAINQALTIWVVEGFLPDSSVSQGQQYPLIAAPAAGLVLGVITGFVLLDLLRHPTALAEWDLKRRRARWQDWSSGDTQPSPDDLIERARRR